ncbi:MAG: SDR family oxidoreductase [Salinivenus sp.]
MAVPPRILVTGATGFVGSVLVRCLVSDGAQVRVFRRSTSSLDLLGPAAAHVEHAVGDVTHAPSVHEALVGIDRVYHVAAKMGFASRDEEALRRVNAQGTANVVNAALEADVERVVHTSSMAAFGRPADSDAIIDETTTWRDAPHRSAYARSKRKAELEVHRGIAEGLDAVIVNPSLIFGVGNEETRTRRIVDAIRSGWLPAVPPGGTNVVDVKDVVAGLRAAMRHGATGRRYFLGAENLSWHQIAGALAKAFGVAPPRYTVPPSVLTAGGALAEAVGALTRSRPVFTRSLARTAAHTYRYNNDRACTELGCTFRPFADTARRIARALSGARGE